MADILVCLKWVDNRPEVDPLTGVVATDDRFSGAGPADRSALEWALRITDTLGGSVHVVTAGPPSAEPMLRDALATGAARATLIEGAGDEPSATIADRLAPLCDGMDYVCTGLHSLDRGSGSVPAFLAARLDLPQALGLVDAAVGPDGRLTVERRLDHGRRERLAVRGRCVFSFEGGPELRRASLASTLAAKAASIDSLPPQPGLTAAPAVIGQGPYRPRPKVKPAPTGDTRERLASLIGAGDDSPARAQTLDLEPPEAARVVVDHLIEWGYLGSDEDGGSPSPTT